MMSEVATLNPISLSTDRFKRVNGGEDNGRDDDSYLPPSQSFPVDKSVLGLLIFMATELMFFIGFINAYLILRVGATDWPPVDQPRLPVVVTGINTLFLLFSGYTVYRAAKAVQKNKTKDLNQWLIVTGILGIIFLGVQGYEWVRLLGYGLTLSSSLYGGTFYTIIGTHGFHVFIAVIILLFVLGKALRRGYSYENHTGVILCEIYWLFVVGIWPLLYILVYLN